MKVNDRADDTTSEAETQSEPRTPFWAVGLGLLAFVVIALVLAFIFDSELRPSVGIETVAPNAASQNNVQAPGSGTPPTSLPSGGSSTPSPTAAQDERQVIEHAYLEYWNVYSEALFTLEASRLEQVMAGQELQNAMKEIDELRSQNRAAKIDVQHDYTIVNIGPNKAGVQDRYLNKSYLVDATTKQPLQSPGEGETEDIVGQLEKLDGKWKVTSISQRRP
ncbi:MAG: hypothetical protein HY689_02005 [Chloroflexi bacterium]|nr:hypothetical protein [Chloroflexota bacterium]